MPIRVVSDDHGSTDEAERARRLGAAQDHG